MPSSIVEYSLSLISPTTPSSSPPTAPTSISRICLAFEVRVSSSSAICRFSSTGTAEPSHMCELKSGSSPRSTRACEIAIKGLTYLSSFSFWQ